MTTTFDVGPFDLDLVLRDAALDPLNRPTHRMLANASLGVATLDAYYSTRELTETLEGVHEATPNAKARLARILSTECDDYQRCLYYCVAGRGVVQMLDDLQWLLEMLETRARLSGELRRKGDTEMPLVAPYLAEAPDGPVVSADPDFEQGPSWWLDPDLGGIIQD